MQCVEPDKPMPTDTAIPTVPSSEITGSNTRTLLLIPLAYAEDVLRINDELDKNVNWAKSRKPTFMESLKSCRVIAHDTGD